jgi:hypothetical protein
VKRREQKESFHESQTHACIWPGRSSSSGSRISRLRRRVGVLGTSSRRLRSLGRASAGLSLGTGPVLRWDCCRRGCRGRRRYGGWGRRSCATYIRCAARGLCASAARLYGSARGLRTRILLRTLTRELRIGGFRRFVRIIVSDAHWHERRTHCMGDPYRFSTCGKSVAHAPRGWALHGRLAATNRP